MDLSNIISYFRSCYEADHRSSGILDFFASKVQHRKILSGTEELVNREMPKIPVPAKLALQIDKTIRLYTKEKELLYASMFLVSNQTVEGFSVQRICCPLLLFPAQLSQVDDLHFLSIEHSEMRVNPAALQLLKPQNADTSNFYHRLAEVFQSDSIGFKEVGDLGRAIRQLNPEIDTEPSLLFPKLASSQSLKKLQQQQAYDGIYLVAGSGYGVVDKSMNTLGVLSELDLIAQAESTTSAIEQLLAENWVEPNSTPKKSGLTPTILSRAQQLVVTSAQRHAGTVLIGPPGTGKSYTIAAMAIDHVSRGESVLVVSKNDAAVDVVHEKIAEQLQFSGLPIRAGKGKHIQQLRYKLARMLNANYKDLPAASNNPIWASAQLTTARNALHRANQSFANRVQHEIEIGQLLISDDSKSMWHTVHMQYLRWINKLHTPHWRHLQQIDSFWEKINRLSRELTLDRFRKGALRALQTKRKNFSNLYAALQAKRIAEREALLEQVDFEQVLHTFPVWLSTLSELNRALPLQKGMFDLVVVDESSQCDIASLLPALYRAKRVVFAGDPKQLRHLSFLSRAAQSNLMRQHELDALQQIRLNYRDKSVLDLALEMLNSGDQIAFLNEHYRSTPEIIAFSNREFYKESINIMTDHPGRSDFRSLEWVRVGGTRVSGINVAETKAIVKKVKEIVRSERGFRAIHCTTIGVLSPFRDQINHLRMTIAKALSSDAMERHNIMLGTAHQFQGEERDVMLLSFALDSTDASGAYNYLNREDMFNVAITRAKRKQIVFTSFDPSSLKQESLVWRFFHHLLASRQAAGQRAKSHHDIFLNEVVEALTADGFEFLPDYSLGGMQVDLVVRTSSTALGIDLIGYPGDFQDAFTMERYQMLGRAGLRVFPLPFSYWCFERKKCLQELEDWLAQ